MRTSERVIFALAILILTFFTIATYESNRELRVEFNHMEERLQEAETVNKATLELIADLQGKAQSASETMQLVKGAGSQSPR